MPNTIFWTKDFLPNDHKYFTFLKKVFRHEFRKNWFRRISTPILEDINLQKSVYSDSYVTEHIYSVEQWIWLRNEPSLWVINAYLKWELDNEIQPVYLYHIDRYFSKDLSNCGYKENYLIGWDIIWETDPILDAILIYITYSTLNKIWLNNSFEITINAVPNKKEMDKYIEELKSFYENKKHLLSEEWLKNLSISPLKLLKSENEDEQILAKEAPIITKFLKKDSKAHFEKFKEYLDSLNVPYNISNWLVPDFSHYLNSIWNIKEKWTNKLISSWWRYNYLSKSVWSDKEIWMVWFTINVDCLVDMLKQKDIKIKNKDELDLYFVQLWDEAKKVVLWLSLEAREKWIKAMVSLWTPSMKEQILKAQRTWAKFVVMVGIMEARNWVFQVRDMIKWTQEEVKQVNLINYIIWKIWEENLDFYCPARDLTIG